jgi:CubicO group peptidase (beta-lactamase class C family)
MNFLKRLDEQTTVPEVSPGEVGFSVDRLARIRMAIERDVAANIIPGGVLAVARRGKLAYLEAFGHREAASAAPMQTDAVFSIASMTKAMTSVAALQLLEEGLIGLADPVSGYLPDLANPMVADPSAHGVLVTRPATRSPTIQDLLRHTSGMTYRDRGTTPAHKLYPGSSITASVKYSRAEFLAAMGRSPLLHEPGTMFEYGFSTDVLGHVVEAVTGKPLGQVLAERIWKPLGMVNTAFELSAALRPRYARAFPNDVLSGAPATVHHAGSDTTKWESGGGGAVSTAVDYLKFAEMLRRGGKLGTESILGRKTVELMTSDHLGPDAGHRIADTMDPSSAGYGFGLGVAVRREAGISALPGSKGDYYWSGVYGTYFWVDPSEQLSCVWMAASPGLVRLRYRPMIRALVYQAIEN